MVFKFMSLPDKLITYDVNLLNYIRNHQEWVHGGGRGRNPWLDLLRMFYENCKFMNCLSSYQWDTDLETQRCDNVWPQVGFSIQTCFISGIIAVIAIWQCLATRLILNTQLSISGIIAVIAIWQCLTTRWILNTQLSISGIIAAIAWPATLMSVSNMIDNPWSVCIQRATAAGKELAETLLAREQVLFTYV